MKHFTAGGGHAVLMGGPTVLKLATPPVVPTHGCCPSSMEALRASFGHLNPTNVVFFFKGIRTKLKIIKIKVKCQMHNLITASQLLLVVRRPLPIYSQRKWGLPYIASALNAQSATAGLQSQDFHIWFLSRFLHLLFVLNGI